MTYNIEFMVVFGVLVIVAVGIWVWMVRRKNPNLKFGDIINKMVLEDHVSIFVLGLIFFNFSEGFMAASIEPEGQTEVNPLARLLTHGVISVMGIVCGVLSPAVFRSAKQTEDRDRKVKLYTLFLLVLIGAVLFPYLNLLVMSGGARQTHYLMGLLSGNIIYFMRMDYVLQASVCSTLAHYFLVAIDAMIANTSKYVSASLGLGDFDEEGAKGKKPDPIERNREKYEKKATEKADDGIKFLMVRYGYSGKQLNAKIDSSKKAKDAMPEKDRMELSKSIYKLVQDIKNWDNGPGQNASKDEKKDKNKKFRKRIYDLWKASTSGGKGFGMELKKKDFGDEEGN